MALHRVSFPQKQTSKGKDGTIKLEYNSSFIKNFNENLNKTQTFLDSTVGRYLKDYVTYDKGTQEKSIDNAGTYGTGKVMINVPYAEYQAYSPRIRDNDPQDPKRGKRPFERMKADKAKSILKQVEAYSRRLNGQ